MTDFLLELRCEEIPARMQARARVDLARIFEDLLINYGVEAKRVETFSTPRRLALIARGLPLATEPKSQERKGPRADAPEQAIAGFLRSTHFTRDELEERTDSKGNRVLFAVQDVPGEPLSDVLNTVLFGLISTFPWPKSMRWGAASASTESLRWVRPLQGIVALFGEHIVPFEIAGIRSGAATLGHRFHHPGIITIGAADHYAAKLRACHVILDADERATIIRDGARAAASAAGLTLVEDDALVAENAGLTEWPVPLLGRFDPAFLAVPPEVIQLTMRTNQKYFSCNHPDGTLAPAFVCTANIAATDGGAAIVRGNERVLSARLADAKFFWEADLKVPLEEQAKKLDQIVFHEKLGTVADKVERVAKLARWLIEEGIVNSSPARGGGPPAQPVVEGGGDQTQNNPVATDDPLHPAAARRGPPPRAGEDFDLAQLATRAASLCKADLVTQMVGEFPELQGTIGGYLATAQGEHPQVAAAIRDHYKPVGQGDEVPTAPVTVAVSLADKLDTILSFFTIDEEPTGSRDPFALRRACLGAIKLILENKLRFDIRSAFFEIGFVTDRAAKKASGSDLEPAAQSARKSAFKGQFAAIGVAVAREIWDRLGPATDEDLDRSWKVAVRVLAFFGERLVVQQREAGVRHDLIDAVFALGGEDDLVRLLARVHALQAFVETPEGADLLAGYKRAANILKKEGFPSPPVGEGRGPSAVASAKADGKGEGDSDPSILPPHPSAAVPLPPSPTGGEGKPLSYTPDPVEQSLITALDSAEPRARAAVEQEDFSSAMAALATLRAPVDRFFENVTVNDPDPAKREARLDLLARMRAAIHAVADFSRIEG